MKGSTSSLKQQVSTKLKLTQLDKHGRRNASGIKLEVCANLFQHTPNDIEDGLHSTLKTIGV